jgi:hypothetical protein
VRPPRCPKGRTQCLDVIDQRTRLSIHERRRKEIRSPATKFRRYRPCRETIPGFRALNPGYACSC